MGYSPLPAFIQSPTTMRPTTMMPTPLNHLPMLQPFHPQPVMHHFTPVSSIRLWTRIYSIMAKTDKINHVMSITAENSKALKNLLVTNEISLTYQGDHELLLNVLKIIPRLPECRFRVSARGFCENLMTFLKGLPRIDSFRLYDICSNEPIDFAQILQLLTNATEIEKKPSQPTVEVLMAVLFLSLDMMHIKCSDDPGVLLMNWHRPANIHHFILCNLPHSVNTAAVQQFVHQKILPGAKMDFTYEKIPKEYFQ